jgi:GNAT superfamily N-acetyltransferase
MGHARIIPDVRESESRGVAATTQPTTLDWIQSDQIPNTLNRKPAGSSCHHLFEAMHPRLENMSHPLIIRPARPDEAGLVHEFILGLAQYEKLSHEVQATVQDLDDALFGKHPGAEVIFAFWENEPAGFALFFHNFSTFVGRKGLYLEDLFVKPEFRGKGIGNSLLLALVKLAKDRKCGRMDWVALDWNKTAIDFYEGLGAKAGREWVLFRLDEEGIAKLAGQ